MPADSISASVIARNLQRFMDAADLKDRDMEQRTGISAKMIYNIRHGHNQPTVGKLDAIAAVFGLQAWELMVDQGDINNCEDIGNFVSQYLDATPQTRAKALKQLSR